MNKLFIIFVFFLFTFVYSCARLLVDEKSKNIGYAYGECLDTHAWDTLFLRYSTINIKDSTILNMLKEFDNQPFNCRILYFDEEPIELVGVDSDIIRYVYNPKLSNEILNGLELDRREKNRIANRVQMLLIEFQCDEGKKQSLEQIKYRK